MAQLPVDQVLQLRQQGYSDNQVVQELQRQGFSAQQIYDAMSQADFSKLSGGPVEQPAADMPPPPPSPEPQPQQNYPQYSAPAVDDERISEVAEAIINEKWEEIIPEIKALTQWKEEIESEIQKLKDGFQNIKDQFSELHKGVLGRISEYDGHIRDVSSELKAVEKVFKDIIPEFTQNVSELSRVTKTLKKK